MAGRKIYGKRKAILLKISERLWEKLTHRAQREERAKIQIINEILERGLK